MIIRAILPPWAKEEFPERRVVREGEYTVDEYTTLNRQYYNIYYLPNYPSFYERGKIVDGNDIDTFEYVYVDMDLKDGVYATKDEFIEKLGVMNLEPNRVVDSGNGVHVYWRVQGLDALTFLKIQRRLCRQLSTDEAVAKIYQLMRVPGTLNTKRGDNLVLCETLFENEEPLYAPEHFDTILAPITKEDEDYCQDHYNKTYKSTILDLEVDDKIPLKFSQLIKTSKETKDIWLGNTDDRSASDYRLGHIMHGSGFTKDEAMSVLVNSAKALSRSPKHRIGYAANIIDKIWVYELSDDKEELALSSSVADILKCSPEVLKGTRLSCWSYIDATAHGFRLGQVLGLVAGSGVGKTAMALNMFQGFVRNNPDMVHFFIPLEQPVNEIADRWKTMCGENTQDHDKVHVISNYGPNGEFRHLSFLEIKDYLLKFQETTKQKVGCVVIDHIGALKKKGQREETQDLMTICHEMKAFAIETNTLLIMQSQTSREKAGIGDLELNKDAAYGTIFFESYCDYLITIWQPLKRMYEHKDCPSVTSFKFCKIRHKKRGLDDIQEDVKYNLIFDNETEKMRILTQQEEKTFDFFAKQALTRRKEDRKTDLVTYTSITWTKEESA